MNFNLLLILFIVLSGFISCVLALIINRFLPIICIKYLTILFAILFILILLFFIGNNQYIKMSNQQFELTTVYKKEKITAKYVIELANFTKLFVENGCGGLLRKYKPIDIKSIIPSDLLIQSKSKTIFWTYEFYPKSIGYYDNNLTFYGNTGKSNTIYFSFVPNKIAKKTKIIFSKTIEKKL